MEDLKCKKRVRDDSEESGFDSPEAKRLRDDFLEFLDDTGPAPSSQDLDSVMKSLQEEISGTSSPFPLSDLSDSGEPQPQIGYLLEASDDELGLPPPVASSAPDTKNEEFVNELIRVSSDSSGVGDFWEFEYPIPSYDSFELGSEVSYNVNTEYVAFDGLFDHSDVYYDSEEFSDSRRRESWPAL